VCYVDSEGTAYILPSLPLYPPVPSSSFLPHPPGGEGEVRGGERREEGGLALHHLQISGFTSPSYQQNSYEIRLYKHPL